MRAVLDGFRLFWPIKGAYRLFLLDLADLAWPVMRPLAFAYRRLVIPRTCLIVVIGSLGKTTTRRVVEAAFGGHPPQFIPSNFGVRLAANVLRIRPWHRQAVLEVGIDRRGWMTQFARMLAPDVVVVTSIASSHNRTFRTLEETRAEKVAMVRALGPQGLAVLNGDDPHARWMGTQTSAPVVTVGFGEDCDIRASQVQFQQPAGMRLLLHAEGQTQAMQSQLVGRHFVYALLAAVAVARGRGQPLQAVLPRLEAVSPTPTRLQLLTLPSGVRVLDDTFKAPPESVRAALEALEAMPAARRVVVLGDIEEPNGPAYAIYREIGRQVARCAQRAILVGGRKLETLKSGAVQAGMAREALTHVGSSIDAAIALLREELRSGDVVLVKARGAARFERIVLALQDLPMRCAVKVCKVRAYFSCRQCPLRDQDPSVFQNVHLRPLGRF